MIGDITIINEKDFLRANKIYKELKDQKIILIGGGSGTKKSELAYCLQKILYDNKKSSFVISLDDYYTCHASIRNLNRKKNGLQSVGICELDWQSLHRIYEDFVNKKDISFRRTHRFLEAIEHNVINSEIDYLLFEGLYANYLRKFYNDNFSVFLEGTPAQTLEFRKLRAKENENDEFRKLVVQREFNITAQLKRHADFILSFQGE